MNVGEYVTSVIPPTYLVVSKYVFTRILAAATINFSRAQVRLLIEGGSYSRAALIKNNVLTYAYARANAMPDQNFMLARI